jgi:hypothetical protein
MQCAPFGQSMLLQVIALLHSMVQSAPEAQLTLQPSTLVQLMVQ